MSLQPLPGIAIVSPTFPFHSNLHGPQAPPTFASPPFPLGPRSRSPPNSSCFINLPYWHGLQNPSLSLNFLNWFCSLLFPYVLTHSRFVINIQWMARHLEYQTSELHFRKLCFLCFQETTKSSRFKLMPYFPTLEFAPTLQDTQRFPTNIQQIELN
jgi:hypothetical protein